MINNEIQTFVVDSFTDQPFKGNPAGVCLVENAIHENRMQLIAQELNLSETAFVVQAEKEGSFAIRYFSPKMEIPLCGHATLASSKILFEKFGLATIEFTTSQGLKLCVKEMGGMIEMEFPVYELEPATVNDELLAALGIDSVTYAGFNKETNILMLEIEGTEVLQQLRPDFARLQNSHDFINGVSVTAQADDQFDFHSRYFWPWSGGNEDPVTGGTHTFLAKYWGEKLGKKKMRSFQSSTRTGQMEVELAGHRVLFIRGQAVVVLAGVLKC